MFTAKRIFILIAGFAFIFLNTACATITRGTMDTLVIETEPPGANATLSNGLQCKTPCSLKLPRKESVVVKIEKSDYEPVEVNVTPQIVGSGSAGMAGNIIFGGLIGAAIDAGSGAMYDLKPNPINVKLQKKIDSVDSLVKDKMPVIREKTLAEKLQELQELKEKGLINEEEYLKKRESLIKDF